jgi:hypothetical protein
MKAGKIVFGIATAVFAAIVAAVVLLGLLG